MSVVQISGISDGSKTDTEKHNQFIGLVAVLCAACTSGFSGVYFEKILKGAKTSLWLRNVQMGIPSVVIAFITIYAKDSTAVAKQGFLGGYTPLVWTVVTVQVSVREFMNEMANDLFEFTCSQFNVFSFLSRPLVD